MAAAIGRLTVNIGRPREGRRRVYASVGGPIRDADMFKPWLETDACVVWWSNSRLSLRMIRAYCTVSHEAAAILTKSVSFRFVKNRLRRTFTYERDHL